MSGSLPEQLADLAALEYISLSNNEALGGPLPLSFSRLTVSSFYANGTSLCVPPELTGWYETIGERDDLPVCRPPSPDRGALVSFYHDMGGENWHRQHGWLGLGQIDSWEGVETDSAGRVTGLSINRNNLTGPLSLELTKLSALTNLGLFGNEITGQIPPELGNLTGLVNLYLAENRFTGSIPPELGNLRNLEELYLSHNGLTGPIPPELNRLSALEVLWLHNNSLTGGLPPPGDLVKLRKLLLSNNRLSGPIPPEWGKVASLEELHLSQNNLTGRIPPELGQLENIRFLWLWGNNLSGPIPPELGNLRQLESLALSLNRLSGPIPPELGNAMSGVPRGRPDEGAAGAMRRGREPEGFAGLDAGKLITLSNNQLTGPLPPEIGNIPNLEVLFLHENEGLTGLLPRSLTKLRAMLNLNVQGTGLCPPLDRTFQSWAEGVGVFLIDRSCTPTKTDRLALEQLFAEMNGDGWASAEGWGTDRALRDWHGVSVSGGSVSELALSGNGLAGAVSVALGSLTWLRSVDVSDNRLAGSLPSDLASLVRLGALNVSGNENLTGRLPFALTLLRSLDSLLFDGTGLCAPPSTTFQSWLAAVDNVAGATCGNVAEVRLSIPFATLTQSVQRPENDVALIAGRDALLRAFLVSDVPGAYFEPQLRAALRVGGRETWATTIESGSDEILTEPDQSSLERSFNAIIPGEYIVPGIELSLEADPGGVVPAAAGSERRYVDGGIEVVNLPPLEITLVPVLEATQPDSSVLGWVADTEGSLSFFRHAFPLGEMRASHRASFVTSLNLASDDASWNLLLELEAARLVEGATGYWYGAGLSRRGYFRGIARFNGPVAVGKPWATEVAHEVGHLFGLKHAPCGGVSSWVDPDFPYPGGGVGVWGFDFRTESLVSPVNRRDIMGYCYEISWISDYHYEWVLDHRLARGPAVGAPRESLILRGGVFDGEVRLGAPFVIDAPPSLPQPGGEYRLEVEGPDGSAWLSLSFTPGEDPYGNRYFGFSVPIESNSPARVVLVGPEGSVAVDADARRAVTVVRDPVTRQVRGILRDWTGPLPGVFGGAALEAITTRGLALDR